MVFLNKTRDGNNSIKSIEINSYYTTIIYMRKIYKQAIVLLSFMLLHCSIYAQEKAVPKKDYTGFVTDKSKNPVENASIEVQEKTLFCLQTRKEGLP